MRFAAMHPCTSRLELYLGRVNPGNRAQRLFDTRHAVLAGHALDREFDALEVGRWRKSFLVYGHGCFPVGLFHIMRLGES